VGTDVADMFTPLKRLWSRTHEKCNEMAKKKWIEKSRSYSSVNAVSDPSEEGTVPVIVTPLNTLNTQKNPQ
jgi:hypothetical protein